MRASSTTHPTRRRHPRFERRGRATAIPIVATVDEALAYGPTTATVGVATQGGRFPAWRELLKDSIRAGLDLESGLHEFISDDPELSGLAREHGVELRDLRSRRRAQRPYRREPPGPGEDRPHRRLRLRDREEDRRRRARPRLEAWPEVRLRPDRPDRNRDRGLGDRDRRRRGPRRRGGTARGRGLPARRRVLWVEGQGSPAHPAYSGVTMGLIHGSAPHAYVFVHKARATHVEGYPTTHCRSSAS